MAATTSVRTPEWSPEILALYETHFDGLVDLGRRSAGRDGLAEEAVQEAFIKFCTTDCQPAPGKELAYLRSMVVNGVRSSARREVRRVEITEQLPPAPQQDVEEEVSLRVEGARAEEAIRNLPRRQRLVMTLRYMVGLSERETAEAVGVAPGTVKVHASRGREAVRTEMLRMNAVIH